MIPADNLTAGEVAATEVLTVSPDDTMRAAAQLMAEHETAHLVVVQRHSGHPVGVLSTLDLAACSPGAARPSSGRNYGA